MQAALAAGADIVIALPAPYACATAEQFAAAGVYLLATLGCDTLAFGAETPDAEALLDAYGVEDVPIGELDLTPGLIARARAERGDPPLS